MLSYPRCTTGLLNHHRAYSWKFHLSKHFNLIIWNVNGGRTQSVESGASFSICRTAILFQIANWPLFPDHTGSWNVVTHFLQLWQHLRWWFAEKRSFNIPTFLWGCGSWKRWGSFLFSSSWKKANQIWSSDPQQKYDDNWSRWLNTVAFHNSLVRVWHTNENLECLIMIFWLTRTLNQGSRNCGILVSGMGKVEKEKGKARKK